MSVASCRGEALSPLLELMRISKAVLSGFQGVSKVATCHDAGAHAIGCSNSSCEGDGSTLTLWHAGQSVRPCVGMGIRLSRAAVAGIESACLPFLHTFRQWLGANREGMTDLCVSAFSFDLEGIHCHVANQKQRWPAGGGHPPQDGEHL